MAGTPPMYGNARWGGPQGIRIPYEMTKSAMLVKKEIDLGTMAGTTITLDPSQAAASYITATPTANSIIYFPAVNEGLPVVINNLAPATYTLTVGVTGNATTVSVAAASTAIIVHDKATGGVVLAGGSTGGASLGNTAITGTLSVSGLTTLSAAATVGTTLGVTGALTASSTSHLVGAVTADSTITWKPKVQTASGATDAVLFADALNVCIFTSTGPDAATLATPGAGDVGKILLLVNTNTTQNKVTTAANKILNGSTPGDTLTAPATAGAVAVLIATNGFWNFLVGGTGSWVLSEV